MMDEYFTTLYNLNLTALDSTPLPYSAAVLQANIFVFMLQAYFQSLVTNKQKSSGLNPEYIVWMQY
jgi:hypothetical protein